MSNINQDSNNLKEPSSQKQEITFFKDLVCLGYIASVSVSTALLTYSCSQSLDNNHKPIQKQELKIKQQNERTR